MKGAETSTANTAFLDVASVTKTFGDMTALDQVNLQIERGEVVSIIGPSGCGKSTLLRCINWLQEPDAGAVFLDGKPIGRVHQKGSRRQRWHNPELNADRARIGMVFQQFNVWPHLNVLENVTRAQMVVLKRSRNVAENKAKTLLDEVGLADKINAWPDDLSGGQKQRVGIARALAMDPILMLLDEPTSALDPELVTEVLAVLKTLAGRGMTMLIVTHELGFAANVANRIIFMEAGRIVEQGPPASLLKTPKTDRLRLFLQKLQSFNSFDLTERKELPVISGK